VRGGSSADSLVLPERVECAETEAEFLLQRVFVMRGLNNRPVNVRDYADQWYYNIDRWCTILRCGSYQVPRIVFRALDNTA
jgi:hypothetical protein